MKYLKLFILCLSITAAKAQVLFVLDDTLTEDAIFESIFQQTLPSEFLASMSLEERANFKQYLLKKNPEFSLFVKKLIAEEADFEETPPLSVEFPDWLVSKMPRDKKYPSVVVDIREDEELAMQKYPERKHWYKRYNVHAGLGLVTSIAEEIRGERKIDSVGSDVLQLKARASYTFFKKKKYPLTYFPELSIANLTPASGSLIDIDLGNYFATEVPNRFNIQPLLGLRYFKTSHIYINTSLVTQASIDHQVELSAGAYLPFRFINRNWYLSGLYGYTPIYSMDHTEVADKNLTGTGYKFSLITESFSSLFIDLTGSVHTLKNNQMELKRYLIGVSFLYRF